MSTLNTISGAQNNQSNYTNWKQSDGSIRAIPATNQATNAKTVAGGTGTTVVSAAAGRLARINVTTGGTGSSGVFVSFYDNATTTGSSPIACVPGSAVAGTIYELNI